MVLIAPQRIEAPPVRPALGGLLSVADITEIAGDSHAAMGVDYYTYLCGTARLFDAWCVNTPGITYDFVKQVEGGTTSQGWPFVVYAGVECDLFGREEYGPAAAEKLRGGEERAVAEAFAGQVFATGSPVDVTGDVGTPVEILEAVAKLEQYAGENYAGLPILHMSRGNVIRLASEMSLVPNLDGTLSTILGTPIAASAGYSDDLIFITGAVHLWRTAVLTTPTDTLLKNTAMAIAERVYVAATDCVLAYAGDVPPPPPAATVTTIAPTTGRLAGGQTVTITGTNLNGTQAVLFGNVPGTNVQVVSPTSVTVVTPQHVAGVVDVVVVHPYGDVTKPGAFTFQAATLTTVAPATGVTTGGTAVTLTGTGFSGATSATFGGVPGTAFTVVSDTSITVTSPAHAAGAVTVVVAGPAGSVSKASGFTYTAPPPPAPTVTTVAPATGPAAGSTRVTLTGTNLTGTTGVTFGGAAGSGMTVDSATAVSINAPSHAEGVVDVVLQNPAGNVTKTGAYTYTA